MLAQEAPLVRAVEQHLRDRQTDQITVGDPHRLPKRRRLRFNEELEQWQNDIDEAFERGMKATGRMDQA